MKNKNTDFSRIEVGCLIAFGVPAWNITVGKSYEVIQKGGKGHFVFQGDSGSRMTFSASGDLWSKRGGRIVQMAQPGGVIVPGDDAAPPSKNNELPPLPIHTTRPTGITMPLLPGISTPAELLAHHARVSSTANQFNHETGPRLIKRLIERNEPSPLEQISINFEVHTTRDIGRQMIRHWSLRPQEFSGRYAKMDSRFYPRECRLQHPTDRQMSVELDMENPEHQILEDWWEETQTILFGAARRTYEEALERGIAKECARAILPEGNTGTTMYFTGRLRDWYFYCKQRMDIKTQKEHRSIANSIAPVLLEYFPMLEGLI